MKSSNFFLVLAVSILLTACNFNINPGERGNGNVISEERPVTSNFTEVRGSSGLDVYLTHGETPQIIVEADENLLPYIETEIEGGKLKISTSGNIGRSTAKKVFVTFTELNRIEASSGAEVVTNSVVESQNLSLRSSSGADLEVSVFSENLIAKASSGAEMVISGKASNLEADASSGSEIEAKDLKVITCKAEASSGAEVIVNVKDRLTTNATSGGEINYYGNPVSVDSNKSRSGSVKKM